MRDVAIVGANMLKFGRYPEKDVVRLASEALIGALKDAGVDFLILETFFHLAEMKVALQCAASNGLPAVATMSFRPFITNCADAHTPAECAKVMADLGAIAVGANCEQEPRRMLPLLREMRASVSVPLAAQPAAFRTTDDCHCFTRQPAFPDDLETIQVSRREFVEFGRLAKAEAIGYAGGCCGCNPAYIRALARGLAEAKQDSYHLWPATPHNG